MRILMTDTSINQKKKLLDSFQIRIQSLLPNFGFVWMIVKKNSLFTTLYFKSIFKNKKNIPWCSSSKIGSNENEDLFHCLLFSFLSWFLNTSNDAQDESTPDADFQNSGVNPANKLNLHDTYWRKYNEVVATWRIYIKRWGLIHLDKTYKEKIEKKITYGQCNKPKY